MGQDTWVPPEPKTVFVTDGTYVGNLGWLTGADAKCQAEADAAGLAGTYKAWLSTSIEGPDTRFVKSTGPYVLVNGMQVAASWTALTAGLLSNPINITPTGLVTPTDHTWTNTLTSGLPWNFDMDPLSDTCDEWTSAEGGLTGFGGFTYETDRWSSGFGYASCELPKALYCFQQ